eukprot:533937-Amphidinium_carterae.2
MLREVEVTCLKSLNLVLEAGVRRESLSCLPVRPIPLRGGAGEVGAAFALTPKVAMRAFCARTMLHHGTRSWSRRRHTPCRLAFCPTANGEVNSSEDQGD